MSKAKKILISAAIIMVIIGSLVFVAALGMLNFDVTKLNVQKYEANSYTLSEDFNKISINTTMTKIIFIPADDGICKVECYEQEKIKHSVTVQDGALVIDAVDTREWYDHIGVFFGSMKLTVSLPKYKFTSLFIDTDTGDVEIPKNFSFEDIKISSDTANISCYAAASKTVELSTDTGKIEANPVDAEAVNLSSSTGSIGLSNVTSQGMVNIVTNTGDVKLSDVNCKGIVAESDTGNISLKNVISADSLSIENNTGNVRFENSDAASISVKTSTGGVKGTLRSEKVFIVKTSTGKVKVPETASGGKCKITTDTGDVEIDIN